VEEHFADLRNFEHTVLRSSVFQQYNLVEMFLFAKFLEVGIGKRKFSYTIIAVICLF